MENTTETATEEGDGPGVATAETCVYQGQEFPRHTYTDDAGAILTGPDERTYCATCGWQPAKSTDADKPVHVGLIDAQRAGKLREVTGSLVNFDDPGRWPCMPRMVAAMSPEVREVARVARARELQLWNDTERGDGKDKKPKKLTTDGLPVEYQRRWRADIVVACMRGGGTGEHAYLDAEGEAVALDLATADDETTQAHFAAAILAAPEVLWLVDDLHRAASLLSGPMAGTDEPKISDRTLLDLEIAKKGFACGRPSLAGMRAGATIRSSGGSFQTEDMEEVATILERLGEIKKRNAAYTASPPNQKPSSASTPLQSGDTPAELAG